MNKKKLIIGGVPEHFNLPWHQLIDSKPDHLIDSQLLWKDFKGGTGAMCKALQSKEIDIAVILTEGIIKDIIEGNPCKIVQTYVQSPLLWGIHVAASSPIYQIEELEGTTAAISRFGSGSHLMSYVLASKKNWNTDQLKFKVIQNLDGAVKALSNQEAEFFMWEHFTTKPLVDQGIFRRIGDCPTPWPCFVIAVREEILQTREIEIKKVLTALNKRTSQFKKIKNIEETLANQYDQKVIDIKEWLEITEWSNEIPQKNEIKLVQNTLSDLGLIDRKMAYKDLIYEL